MIVYLIARTDGKAYVGQTSKTLKQRLAEHIRNDENGIGAAIRREGRKRFEVCVLEECEPCQADVLERHYINALNALEPQGYNRKPGGDGRTPSRRLRTRIKKGKKREPIFYEIDCPDRDPDVLKEAQYLADSLSII